MGNKGKRKQKDYPVVVVNALMLTGCGHAWRHIHADLHTQATQTR